MCSYGQSYSVSSCVVTYQFLGNMLKITMGVTGGHVRVVMSPLIPTCHACIIKTQYSYCFQLPNLYTISV